MKITFETNSNEEAIIIMAAPHLLGVIVEIINYLRDIEKYQDNDCKETDISTIRKDVHKAVYDAIPNFDQLFA